MFVFFFRIAVHVHVIKTKKDRATSSNCTLSVYSESFQHRASVFIPGPYNVTSTNV